MMIVRRMILMTISILQMSDSWLRWVRPLHRQVPLTSEVTFTITWKNNFHNHVKKERHGNITTITGIQAMQYLQADSSFTKWYPLKKTIFQLFHVNSDAAPIVRQHQHDLETRKP